MENKNQMQKIIRVLLCDDQEIVRVALEDSLSSIPNLECIQITTAAEVIPAIRLHKPSLLLQDLVLPDGSGIDVVKAIRAEEDLQDFPILLLSTTEDPAVKLQAFQAGASDYMVKFPEQFELIGRVTYHAKAYESIRARTEALRMLEQKSRLESLGNLAAGIAHEINTPLQYISANVQYVLDNLRKIPTIDADFIAALSETNDGIEQITGIVRAMKSFAHPGKQEMVKVSLNEIMQDVRLLTRNEWKDFATFNLELKEDLPFISGVPGGIAQILINLVMNSAQAIKEQVQLKGIQGSITVKNGFDEDSVWIQLQDNGGGIPAEIQSKIFDPFFTTKDVGVGSGQGLSLARSIVQAHQATITFDTVPNEGTIFTVSFPRQITVEPMQALSMETTI